MAATTAPAGASQVPTFQIVNRLDGVPVVHDSVAYAQSLVNSTQITGSLYNIAVAVASRGYDIATPVLVKTKPLLESADGLAVATFDRAQATFPYPFKTPTEDLIVVKQAKAVYDERLAPIIHSPVISDVINKTAQINSALGARAAATIHSSQELSHALLEQLKALAGSGKDLPAALIDSISKATSEVKGIVFEKDATIQDKSNKLGAYVVDQVKPIVDEIYNYVLGAKNKAKEEGAKAVDQAQNAVQK
ncbi:hypothetical protein P7C73_g2384, partial [Tremellales sp. Uapishka_1]